MAESDAQKMGIGNLPVSLELRGIKELRRNQGNVIGKEDVAPQGNDSKQELRRLSRRLGSGDRPRV